MSYQKVTLEVVVNADDSEVLEQALKDAMDKLEEQVTVFASEIHSKKLPNRRT